MYINIVEKKKYWNMPEVHKGLTEIWLPKNNSSVLTSMLPFFTYGKATKKTTD